MFDARTMKLAATLLILPVLLVLALTQPTSAKTVTYKPQTVYFTYCHSHPPAARIASGDTVVTNTRDASNDVFQPTMKTSAEGSSICPASIRRPAPSTSRAPSPATR